MFITLKKKVIIAGLAAIVAVSSCIAFVAAFSGYSAAASNGIVIVIDAGHGGMDGGVVSKTYNAKESEINLSIAKMLRHLLKKAGYTTVMTRDNAGGLYSSSDSNKKLADMKKRKEIILESKPDLMISIHQNHYPLSSACGPQVFYDDSGKSEEIAALFQSVMNHALGGRRVHKSADYYVLQCSPYPSILVECGFLSNPTDEQNLLTAGYREKVAYSLYTAVATYFAERTGAAL